MNFILLAALGALVISIGFWARRNLRKHDLALQAIGTVRGLREQVNWLESELQKSEELRSFQAADHANRMRVYDAGGNRVCVAIEIPSDQLRPLDVPGATDTEAFKTMCSTIGCFLVEAALGKFINGEAWRAMKFRQDFPNRHVAQQLNQ